MIYGDRTKEHRNQHGRDGKDICYAFLGRIYSIKIIDVNNIGSITLTLINNVSINLSCFHIGMSKHSLNGIDIGVTFKLQGGEGVTGAMECDMLFDARGFNPFLQWTGNP